MNTLGTVENVFGSAKHEKLDSTPPLPPKTHPETENMKAGPDVLSFAEN
jgi:hypothetical protein